jgi:hypothetical protein
MKWSALLALGAYHGINPGMGWLFAVALGLQQGSSRAVWRALPPIALGHLLSVGAVLAAAGLAQLVVPGGVLKLTVASILIAVGLYRLWRHRHPRFGGMQVGFRDLTIWSFLMASAHGAGVMVLPFVVGMPGAIASAGLAGAAHAAHLPDAGTAWTGVLALGVHTAAYLAVMMIVAWTVYAKVGLGVLRKAWFNLDWLWTVVLVAAGVAVLLS